MKKTKITAIALCGAMASMLVACQTDDISQPTGENTQPTEETGALKTYQVTALIGAAQGGAAGTRALEVDAADAKVLHSKWYNKDKILAFVLKDQDKNTLARYNMLTSQREGKSSKFEGAITATRAITKSDEISFLYPGAASEGGDRTITPVVRKLETVTVGTSSKVVTYTPTKNITNLVSLNLTRQDGTAETIGRRFDFQWNKMTPESITTNEVNVNVGKLTRIISIWGLRFTDDKNNILNTIDSVSISNVKSSDVLRLDDSKFVDDNGYEESKSISVIPAKGKKLSSTGGKYTYVAVLPGNYTDVHVMVYANGTCYEKVYPSVRLEADYVYHTDVLNMTEVAPKPYVEVQGVKWATGNFIHYGPKNGGYWGIAPAQWWISGRAVQLNNRRKVVNSGGTLSTSQFADFPEHTIEDVDLFRYGHIAEALDLKNSFALKESIAGKKLFYKAGYTYREDYPGNTSPIVRGDIVWYYTRNNHQKYRTPSAEEIKKLYNDANAIPAYCYTDKGTIVYGAYFTTNNAGAMNRQRLFPAIRFVSSLDKYTNVTALVRSNKGLFLPYTGLRDPGASGVKMRDLSNNQNVYGQYMTTDQSQWKDRSFDFFFGRAEWNTAEHPKGQAKAIRPVWDSGDSQSDPVYKDFRGIR